MRKKQQNDIMYKRKQYTHQQIISKLYENFCF